MKDYKKEYMKEYKKDVKDDFHQNHGVDLCTGGSTMYWVLLVWLLLIFTTRSIEAVETWSGREVVVCLTDSDAAPDVAWVEQMLQAQQRRRGSAAGVKCARGVTQDLEII